MKIKKWETLLNAYTLLLCVHYTSHMKNEHDNFLNYYNNSLILFQGLQLAPSQDCTPRHMDTFTTRVPQNTYPVRADHCQRTAVLQRVHAVLQFQCTDVIGLAIG